MCHCHHAVISFLIALEQIQKYPRPASTGTADGITLLQFMPPTCTLYACTCYTNVLHMPKDARIQTQTYNAGVFCRLKCQSNG